MRVEEDERHAILENQSLRAKSTEFTVDEGTKRKAIFNLQLAGGRTGSG